MGVESSSPRNSASSLEEAADFVPVATVTKDEFNDLLKQHGLPTGE